MKFLLCTNKISFDIYKGIMNLAFRGMQELQEIVHSKGYKAISIKDSMITVLNSHSFSA